MRLYPAWIYEQIPVIIGEFGTVNRVVEEERAEYVGYYAKAADENGIKLIIFDDGGDFTVFDRTTLSWPYETIIEALFQEQEQAVDTSGICTDGSRRCGILVCRFFAALYSGMKQKTDPHGSVSFIYCPVCAALKCSRCR